MPSVIQELCGHSRSDVTLDIYTTVTGELKTRELENFEEILKQQREAWEKRLSCRFLEENNCDRGRMDI